MQFRSNTPFRALKKGCIAALLGVGILTTMADSKPAAFCAPKARVTRMTITAGTVFDLNATGQMPWSHQVRGVVQVSHLGNCKVFFAAKIHDGSIVVPGVYAGKHLFRLEGTMDIITLAGDELHATVNGWADPDPNDPAGKMFLLYYDVEIFEGTGELAGASGCGTIKGAFLFAGPDGLDDTDFRDDKFCDLYAGSATWKYDGVLIFPHHRK